jgi:hypothetical protein
MTRVAAIVFALAATLPWWRDLLPADLATLIGSARRAATAAAARVGVEVEDRDLGGELQTTLRAIGTSSARDAEVDAGMRSADPFRSRTPLAPSEDDGRYLTGNDTRQVAAVSRVLSGLASF